jgi:hypothetical protein
MTGNLRKVISFALLFVPIFMGFLVLYLVLLPIYQPVAMWGANRITLLMSPPTHLEHDEKGLEGFVWTPDEGQRRLRGWSAKTTVHLVYLSAVTLPALLLATPAPWRTRWRLLAIALPLIYLGHVISLVILTRGVYCLQERPGTFICLWGLRVAYTSGQLFAATLWVLLTWHHWFSVATEGEKA